MQYEVSVIIPARNEEFLQRTIDDVLEHTSNKTEIIAILDGYLPNPPLKENSRLTVIYNPESKGQRAGSNQAVKLSHSKYIIKLDAHCAVDEDFDTKMIKAMEESGEDVTMLPLMRNLHAFDWVCKNGHRRYQSPSGKCETCGEPTVKDVVWIAKESPKSVSFRFDKNLHFQYWNEWARRQKGDITESMSIQGSCYMATRKKYLELDLTSEEFNSWGQNGVEVACKTWLSGGRVLVNHRTWYAHMFRTRGGDFGFPYHNPQSKVEENREKTKFLFRDDNWPLAVHKFQWLLDKFRPPEWAINKGMIYYTHNELDERVAKPVREQLQKISDEKRILIVSSSLKKMDFGVRNVRFPTLKRGYLAMFKQILGALQNSSADIIFFTEHDVMYHPSHFDFDPPDKNTFYYNQNVWLLNTQNGHALHYDVNQLSGMCGYKDALVTHFKERYERVEKEGFTRNMGFEPFTHNRVTWKNVFKYSTWKSEFPNIDIKHGENATGQRWKKEQYRNQQLLINWQESENWTIPGWDSNLLIKTFKI